MTYLYTLRFSAPSHFGLEGIGQERVEERVRSDTLWGAVIQKWLLLFQDDPDELCLNSPFHVSSCFPIINSTCFYPLPIGALDTLMAEAASCKEPILEVKELKKIRFVAAPLFERIIAGEKITIEELKTPAMVFPFLKKDERQQQNVSGFSIIQRPRLEINRLCGGGIEGAFFYCSDQFFTNDGGLFFLASFADEDARKKFEASLRLLGDSGLGADRSIGRGMFSFTVAEYSPPEIKKPNAWLLLSLYHPRRDEVENGILEDQQTAYSLTRRAGRAASHLTARFRRHDLWMLEEGSVLGQKPKGDVCKVLERSPQINIPHNVYRNGRAFSLPMIRATSKE